MMHFDGAITAQFGIAEEYADALIAIRALCAALGDREGS